MTRRGAGLLRCIWAGVLLASVAARPFGVRAFAQVPAQETSPWTRASVVELDAHRRGGVVSAWLSNGARVHIRPMPKSDTAAVTIALVGGELLETKDNRGITLLAAGALADMLDPSTCFPAFKPMLEGDGVSVQVLAIADAIQVRVSGPPDAVERALNVVALTLHQPTPGAQAIERARARVLEQIERFNAPSAAQGDMRAIAEAVLGLIFPADEARVRPPTAQTVRGLSVEQVQAWLDEQARHAPVEAGIAGGVMLERGLSWAERVLGPLESRARVSGRAFVERRAIPHTPGPLERMVGSGGAQKDPAGGAPKERQAQRAIVLVGFLGLDPARAEEFRTCRAAARVLDARVRAGLEGAGVPVGDDTMPLHTGAMLMFSPYPDYSMLMLAASVPAAKAEAARAIMNAQFDRLAAQGPTLAELAEVQAKLAADATASESDPTYWTALLARSTITGLDIDVLANGADFYRGLTPEQVRAALAKLWVPRNRVGLVVLREK